MVVDNHRSPAYLASQLFLYPDSFPQNLLSELLTKLQPRSARPCRQRGSRVEILCRGTPSKIFAFSFGHSLTTNIGEQS